MWKTVNKSDTFVKNMLENDGYNVCYHVPGKMEVMKRKPGAMRVYIHVLVGTTLPHKCQIKVQNYTNSPEYKEIFDKYDSNVYDYVPIGSIVEYNKETINSHDDYSEVLTPDENSGIMVASVEEGEITLESLFS
jgi:hypothetical protein